MSFQNKGFWMAKGGGHLTDGDTASDSSSRIEPKRSYQWFTDAAEPEPFPNKKQALQVPNSKPTAGILNANAPNWENSSSLQSIPNQFIDRLFGTETIRTVNFTERNIGPVGTDNSNMRNKGISGQFGNDSPVGFPISPTLEDPETCLSYGGIRKVKVNLVKDSDNGLYEPKGKNSGNEITYIPMGLAYNKEDESEMVMGQSYNRSMVSTSEEGPYNKGETTAIPFSGFHAESNINLLAQPISSYELFYDQSSVQTPESPSKTELDASNADTIIIASRVAKPRPEFAPKNKPEVKIARKAAPNSFPSNVKSLLSTGMLDGVPVKYVSVSREVLHGVIKGTGYLCACQSCNYSKVLNAYEFESHAGPKTKHPNNHIHFENGKTIYQIVQELRSTPESLLFDALQTVTGSPINQKSFRVWKESFQAATRELQRIYGKEELNL